MPEISKPGIYTDFDVDAYHADPCPTPSLTQSIAKILLERAPLHAWHAHPRLNPDFKPDNDTKFDVGNVAHQILIGRGKDIMRLEFDDWRTKAAKEARDTAASAGKLAVLGKHYARAERMAAAAREQLELRGLGNLFRDGHGEVMIAWQERAGGFWCRQLIDWLSPDRLIFADYKTTDMSVAPHCLGRMMVNAGWDIQGAFAESGLDHVDPANAGRRRFLFVVQEAEVPYCLNIVELSEAALTMGRKRCAMAAQIWAGCFLHDRWPGYPAEIVRPEYPGWAEAAVLGREIEHEERRRQPRGAELIMAG